MQCDAYYALAFIPIDNWSDIKYDYQTGDERLVLKPHSYRYRALANLLKFTSENPNNLNKTTLRCDVLRQFIKATRNYSQPDTEERHSAVASLTYNWRTHKPTSRSGQ